MPILRPPYPGMFPAGYSGSQIIRSGVMEDPEQRLYSAGDTGLYGHKNLPSSINGFIFFSGVTNLGASIGMHQPQNLSASVIGSYCQTITPKRYIIGYEDGAPQFLETRQRCQCVSFISSYLKSFSQASRSMSAAIKVSFSETKDLETFIIAGKEIFSSYANLTSVISGYGTLLGSLLSSITGVQCQSLGPQQYVIGYEDGVLQFIDGRPKYRCVSFLSGSIRQVFFEDLSASIYVIPRENRNLGAYLNAVFKQEEYNLRGSIKAWQRDISNDLSAYIKGLVYRDLGVFIRALTHEDLPANVYGVAPKDLSAFIKVWPMRSLPARVRGWQSSDLGATIDWNMKSDLGSYIGTSFPVDLHARLKGWCREATSDLSANVRSFAYKDLPASIRSTYLKDLPAYLFAIVPRDLPARIHGWQEYDLSAELVGVYGPYDLRASINATGGYRDLSAYVKSRIATEVPIDLSASISSYYAKDLSSYIGLIEPSDLSAHITSIGYSDDLPASIFPKMVYMTSLVSISTMEHLDLSSTINFICNKSGYKDFMSYIRCTYLDDLSASIVGYKVPPYSANLLSKVGYAESFIHTDKLPISVSVTSGYQVKDKIPISFSIYKQQAHLSAYINGTYRYNNLGATITPVWLKDYEFDNYKSREIVYDLNHYQTVNWYEIVEMYFKSMVTDYFYVDGEKEVYKTDRAEKWVLELSSYVPENTALNIRRKLHRVKDVYDLSKFNNLDEAVRAAIDYVTSYDYGDISGMITATGGYMNLICSIMPNQYADLSVSISAV